MYAGFAFSSVTSVQSKRQFFGVYDGIIKKGRKRGERKERGKGEERRERRRREGSGREVELPRKMQQRP
jgi:hypothetical protein